MKRANPRRKWSTIPKGAPAQTKQQHFTTSCHERPNFSPKGKQALRLADRVGGAFAGRGSFMRGARADAHLRSRSFFKPASVAPKWSNTLLRPGCFGGQPLPDRPSLVIRKTPVSRPYHDLIRYDAIFRFLGSRLRSDFRSAQPRGEVL